MALQLPFRSFSPDVSQQQQQTQDTLTIRTGHIFLFVLAFHLVIKLAKFDSNIMQTPQQLVNQFDNSHEMDYDPKQELSSSFKVTVSLVEHSSALKSVPKKESRLMALFEKTKSDSDSMTSASASATTIPNLDQEPAFKPPTAALASLRQRQGNHTLSFKSMTATAPAFSVEKKCDDSHIECISKSDGNEMPGVVTEMDFLMDMNRPITGAPGAASPFSHQIQMEELSQRWQATWEHAVEMHRLSSVFADTE